MVSFIDFNSQFLANFQTLTSLHICPVVTHINPIRDTNSEPGLPVSREIQTVYNNKIFDFERGFGNFLLHVLREL